MRLGIIDIGSNTVRLVVWEIYGQGYYRIIDEIKDSLRIGANAKDPAISSENIEKLVDTLTSFKLFAKNLNVDRIIMVATEAIRRAPNRESVLRRIESEVGLETIVLDPYEEAYLDFIGISKSMDINNYLLLDIGGSSTHLVKVTNHEMTECAYLPFGTLTLQEKFHLEEIVSQENHLNMEAFINEELLKIDWLDDGDLTNIVLVGGSARTIGRIDRHKKRYPLTLTHNYTLFDMDIDQTYHQLMLRDAKNRSRLPGLQSDRADLILGALAIVNCLCSLTRIKELRISGKGLREGILFEHINSNTKIDPSMIKRSVFSILSRHDMEFEHPQRVYAIAKNILSKIRPAELYQIDIQAVLYVAAMLHDVGMSIRYYDHEEHSFYIILNSDLNGLNHREILLAAMAARYHRNMDRELSLATYSHLINRLDIYLAEKLGVILALAEALERSLSGNIYEITCHRENGDFILKVKSRSNMDMELREARAHAHKFEEIFHLNLIVDGQVDEL